jgi:hypothetical protein
MRKAAARPWAGPAESPISVQPAFSTIREGGVSHMDGPTYGHGSTGSGSDWRAGHPGRRVIGEVSFPTPEDPSDCLKWTADDTRLTAATNMIRTVRHVNALVNTGPDEAPLAQHGDIGVPREHQSPTSWMIAAYGGNNTRP